MIKPSDARVLAPYNYDGLKVEGPYLKNELIERDNKYQVTPPDDFAFSYRDLLYRPVAIIDKTSGTANFIQLNFCTNDFCLNHGKEQEEFTHIKYKPSRYKITGGIAKTIECTGVTSSSKNPKPAFTCNTIAISNWSVAEEIKRLKIMNLTVKENKEYNFHKADCIKKELNPFDNVNEFYLRGSNEANSKRVQCKMCKKITCIKPNLRKNFTYRQKKGDIVPLFIDLLMSRTPVKRACEILDISPGTYYNKLEWVYQKCLEFLERNETRAFKDKKLDNVWINIDKLKYNLNNVRRKNMGGTNYEETLDKKIEIQLVASAEKYSRYVFRSDIAYDPYITSEAIDQDTKLYHCDHSYSFLRKNERLKEMSYYPQPPTLNDNQSESEYLNEFIIICLFK